MDISREEYNKSRKQWNKTKGVGLIADKTLDKVCCNCGSTENVEFHHIVPLKLGGTNNLSNIVVLCNRCHKAAHNGRHIRDYCNKKISGRPHNAKTEELDAALLDYISGNIGTKECKSRVKLSGNSKIGDMSYYKHFLSERGIESVRNNIDILLKKNGVVRNGQKVGHVIYTNGEMEYLYYAV